MKIWIKTTVVGDAMPYLAGQPVSSSTWKLGDGTCLVRVIGTPAQIAAIKSDVAIVVLTDTEAQTIRGEYPLVTLDVSDNEIDEIAKAQGIDPNIRADIQIPTRGKQVLQDQENYLLSLISEKMKFTKEWWDKEAKNDKWATGAALEQDVKDGKGEAHEFVLSRIRTKHLKHAVACDVPSKIAHDITCVLVPDIALKDRKDFTLEAAQAQGYNPCAICYPF